VEDKALGEGRYPTIIGGLVESLERRRAGRR